MVLLRSRRDQSAAGELSQHLDGDVLAHAEGRKDGFARAVGTDGKDPCVERIVRAPGRHVPAFACDRAACLQEAAERAQGFPLAIAFGAGKPKDLPTTEAKRDALKARAGEILDGQGDPPGRRSAFDGKFLLDRSTDHQPNEIALGKTIVDRVGPLAYAVAKDRHAIGQGQDFRQAMTDVDDRGTAGDNSLHHPAELFDA